LLRMMMTRQLRRLVAAGFFVAAFIGTQNNALSGTDRMRGSAALNGVMHPPEGGPQVVFR
jgi:hypothetical protein